MMNTENKVFFCNQEQFSGDVTETFLHHCTGDAYVLSCNGLYFYDREKQSCEKIQTAEKVRSREELLEIFNTPQLTNGGTRSLNPDEVEKIRYMTKISHGLHGLIVDYQYEAYMHRYQALKLLVQRENFSEFVSSLPQIFANPESILLLFENYKDTALFWARAVAATPAGLQMLQGLINPMELNQAAYLIKVFTDIQFSSKKPKDICQVLGYICDKQYNDSVLAEKWINAGKQFEHVNEDESVANNDVDAAGAENKDYTNTLRLC